MTAASKRILARYFKWKKMAEEGMTQQQIADADGANPSSVSYGLRRLADLPMVERMELSRTIATLKRHHERTKAELTVAKRRVAMLRGRLKKYGEAA